MIILTREIFAEEDDDDDEADDGEFELLFNCASSLFDIVRMEDWRGLNLFDNDKW